MMYTPIIASSPVLRTAGSLALLLNCTCLLNAVLACLQLKYLAARGRAETFAKVMSLTREVYFMAHVTTIECNGRAVRDKPLCSLYDPVGSDILVS